MGWFHWSEGKLGADLDLDQMVAEGILAPEMVIPPSEGSDLRWSAPSLGSSTSHIDLWKLCVAKNKPITILENDAILAPDFSRTVEELTSQVPDFDFIQWGWNWDAIFTARFLGAFGTVITHFSQPEIPMHISYFQQLHVPRTLISLVQSFGIHCYTVSPKGAAALLAQCLPLNLSFIDRRDVGLYFRATTIDGVMNRVYPCINAYAAWPPLTIVENDAANSTVGQNY